MKKIIICLLGCCLLSAVLLGCSKQDSTTEEDITMEKAPAADSGRRHPDVESGLRLMRFST